MKLNEIKAPKSKLSVAAMYREVKEFCDLFYPSHSGKVEKDSYNLSTGRFQTCYYIFIRDDKARDLLKRFLRKHGLYVNDSYSPNGIGVEWSYTPFEDK